MSAQEGMKPEAHRLRFSVPACQRAVQLGYH